MDVTHEGTVKVTLEVCVFQMQYSTDEMVIRVAPESQVPAACA